MNVNEFLTRTKIPIRLACTTTKDWPITISLWYAYIEEKFFCASQKNALVLKYLSKNSRCGFEVAGDLPPYRGVRGRGIAKLDEARGSEILQVLIKKYLKDEKSQLADFLLSRAQKEVAIEIKPLSMFSYDYSDRMKDIKVDTHIDF
jgi:nitroimidazol reductase NimA-like FMN-containing flavoprotein (pyridoxamine 5'-phosphate oxidase superfamily)